VVHLRGHPDRFRVCHATGADGHPLLLTRSTGALAAAMRPAPGESDIPAVLCVDDVPPAAGAPCYGRLWLSGWVRLLAGDQARVAADSYAEVNPCSDLLDLGGGHRLYRLTAAQVRLANGSSLIELDLDDYLTATSDPLHRDEADLLAELTAGDGRRLHDLVLALSGSPPPSGCRAVRVDRFGLVLAIPDYDGGIRRSRLPFPRPVTDRRQLVRLIQ
jgi:hypothetical protein